MLDKVKSARCAKMNTSWSLWFTLKEEVILKSLHVSGVKFYMIFLSMSQKERKKNVSHLLGSEKYCLKMSAVLTCWFPSQRSKLSQDDSYDVMVAIVGRVGFDFSIFLGCLWLAKVGLVQDPCKYEMYSGVAIFHCFQLIYLHGPFFF